MTNLIVAPSFDPLRDVMNAADGNLKSRLSLYYGWLDQADLRWHQPDLAGWRDALLAQGLDPKTIKAYLSTVRGVYKSLLHRNDVRDSLYSFTPRDAAPADRKSFVDEMLTRLSNAIHPDAAAIDVVKVQDRADSEGVRLSRIQAEQLLTAPNIETLTGRRDAALIAILLLTGIREDEACSLMVSDLRQTTSDELALLIRHGKGNKQRMVPYGDADWILTVVESWLNWAHISEGYVFRGVGKGDYVRPLPLTTRAVQLTLAKYPVAIAGKPVIVKPHDCRRTYARLMYEAGMDLVAIQQNLGHSNLKTTLGYIGNLDIKARRTKSVVNYPKLHKLFSQASLFD